MEISRSIDQSRLTITATNAERQELAETEDVISDDAEHDALTPVIHSAGLEWVEPWETGDLTSAPMVGLRNDRDQIVLRWAFMDYQVVSMLERLRDTGKCVLVGGA